MKDPFWTDDLEINTELEPIETDSLAGTYRVKRSVTQSYITPISGFIRPVYGKHWPANEYASGLVVISADISRLSPNHYKVQVTYSTPEESTEDEDGEETDPDEGGSSEMGERPCKVKISDRTSVTMDPLLGYYKLRNKDGSSKYDTADIIKLAVYLSGGWELCANGKYRLKSEPDNTPGHLILPDTPITKYIARGFTKYTRSNTVYTKTYTARTVNASKVGSVGKITNGNFGAPTKTNDGYKLNYLMTRFSVHKLGNHEYEITEEYEQSQPGGWATDLYS